MGRTSIAGRVAVGRGLDLLAASSAPPACSPPVRRDVRLQLVPRLAQSAAGASRCARCAWGLPRALTMVKLNQQGRYRLREVRPCVLSEGLLLPPADAAERHLSGRSTPSCTSCCGPLSCAGCCAQLGCWARWHQMCAVISSILLEGPWGEALSPAVITISMEEGMFIHTYRHQKRD